MLAKIGVQLYTIRNFMKTEEDIRASFARLKALGYDEVQTAGCAIPYADFGSLAAQAGLTVVGTHDDFGRMKADPEEAMRNHRALGTTNMGVGGMPGGCFESLEQLRAFIADANRLAEAVYPHGFKFTYHNHSREFVRLGGKTVMDILVEELDPVRTSFVLDTYWVQHAGGDVRLWLEKLAGRIDILHLKDMAVRGNDPMITEIGQGNLNWDGILRVAEETGVKHYVVEQDVCPGDPFESLRLSAEFLSRFMAG